MSGPRHGEQMEVIKVRSDGAIECKWMFEGREMIAVFDRDRLFGR